MVSSVTHENHMPYRRTTFASWFLMALNGASFILKGEPIFNEFWMMAAICTMVWAALTHFVYFVLQDFKRILDINIFTIKQKKDNPAVPGITESNTTRRNSP